MIIPLPQNLAPFAQVFQSAGVRAYAVGGLVRNTLLGLPASDVDICSPLSAENVRDLFVSKGARVVEKALAMGTVELHFAGLSLEYTAFRGERYAAGGAHRPESVWFSDSLTDDAFRRDFTVNALYADLSTGELTDPTGGMNDLSARLLRATSPEPGDILRADALRVLRLARFAAELGFSMEEKTFLAAKQYAPGLADVSWERKRDELNRILLSDAKYGRTKQAVLEGLHSLTALSAWDWIIPELNEGRDLPQRPDMHRYTVMEHMLHAAAEAPPQLLFRLAGLLHDIGKPRSLAETGRYLAHDRMGAPMAREILRRLRYPNETVDFVSRLVERHMYDIQGGAKEKTLRLRFVSWGRAFTEAMIVMRETDIRGCGTNPAYVNEKWRALLSKMEAERVPFSLAELAVSGADVMQARNVPPSPEVGRILKKLLLHCALRPVDNRKETLFRIAASI